jgi:predicted dehydrogenase
VNEPRLRVGVIGAGYWGPNLVRNFFEAPGSETVAVCDLSAERLEAIRKRYPSVRTTRDYRELVDDPSIEAVCVATPVSTHHKLAGEALAAGKHVLVEKPLTRTVAEAEALVSRAAAAKRVLAVGHTFVYNPAVTKVREILESREIGDVYYVDSQRVNLGLHQFDINVLWDLGPHDISIVLYWLGEEPEWVSCTGACYIQPSIEDVVFLEMGFPSGAIAHAHLSWLAPGKRRVMTVVGSKRMVVYDDVEVAEKVKVFDHGVERMDADELRRSYRAGDIHVPRIAPTEALQIEVRDFIDAIRLSRAPVSDGVAGLRVVRVLEAAMRSLRDQGARVPYRERAAAAP